MKLRKMLFPVAYVVLSQTVRTIHVMFVNEYLYVHVCCACHACWIAVLLGC